MPRNNNSSKNSKAINAKLDNLDAKMDDIYQNTYSSRVGTKKELDRVSNGIFDTVNSILSTSSDIQGIPNISRLYTRMKNKEVSGSRVDTGKMVDDVMDIFSNTQLLDSIAANPELNRYLKSLDEQYDMICKYMPKLDAALEIKKDNVLSSDNFTKEFINLSSLAVSGGDTEALFNSRNDEIKRIYKFDQLAEEIYDETARYGEYFLYVVPYKKALERLLNRQNKTSLNTGIQLESVDLVSNGNLLEGKVGSTPIPEEVKKEFHDRKINIKLEFSNSLLTDTVEQYRKAQRILKQTENSSLYESFITEATSGKLDAPLIPSELEFEDFETSNDGLMNTKTHKDTSIRDIPGCVCKKLTHYNVKPLYIENVCLGYYYIECMIPDEATNNIINSSTFPAHQNNLDNTDDDLAIKFLSTKIAANIDAKFINTNQDLASEIYIMLKYNDKFSVDSNTNIRVTFLPPEDVYHFYFKLDDVTHHGISDLRRALVPAMFYCLLKLTTTVGMVTRGQDKRIYYVKQNVDTNVARTLMNVINQVKKGNMGIRQMESMNNILNITGRYNDHVIPVGPNGDSPIQFEVMEGQRIETPEELMNRWEEEAVNSIDVPIEFVNSTMQVDYAMRFTMSNSKFLRKVCKRQYICEEQYSELYTRIYNYHFGENESHISVSLPAPAFLAMTNGTQLISNAREYAQMMADLEYTEDSPEKLEFIKIMVRHIMPTLVDINAVDRAKAIASVTVAARPSEQEDM